MNLTECPSLERLRAGLEGSAEGPMLAQHVESCRECQSRLETLASGTSEFGGLMREAGRTSVVPVDPGVRAALAAFGSDRKELRLTAGMRVGEYRLEQPIGQGGMGAVWRAIHTRLDKLVALKLLSRRMSTQPEAVARFAREMKAVGRLKHQNIVGAMDAGEWNGTPYLVMEFVDGIDLGRLVKQRGPVGLANACEVARQTALGLQHAHEHGMVHRDVKPGNVMLASDGTVKLLDLGLARLSEVVEELPSAVGDASTACATADLTDTNMLVGTSAYMPPEQRQDPRAVDARADVYALGRTLAFLLTGAADGPVASKVPNGLFRVMQRMLSERPEDRYSTAAAAATALRPWCHGHDLLAAAGGKHRVPRRNHRVLLAAIAVAIVGIGVGVGLYLSEKDVPMPEAGPGPGPEVAPELIVKKDPPKPGQLGMSVAEAETLQKLWAAYLEIDVTIKNKIGMELKLIPPGELNLSVNARARITKPFRIGVTEVTIGQFRKFVDARGFQTEVERSKYGGTYLFKVPNPKNKETLISRSKRDPKYAWHNPGYPGATDDYPVTQVSWNDAVEFCKWLSELEGKTYRLPTRFEQQWAARAGESGRYPGSQAERENHVSMEKYAWTFVNSRDRPQPVGRLLPNAWGLFDVLGNADEMGHDWVLPVITEVPTGLHVDYQGPPTGTHRVMFGGGYNNRATFDALYAKKPEESTSEAGFRVVREP